jgi:hypothetical protein
MTVLDKLATALNRRDEVPNQLLAAEIVSTNDQPAVKELVDNLSNKNRAIQNDCIKVLYEIGARRPDLIAGYYREFGKLVDSRNNRLAWGAMTALDTIADHDPKAIYSLLGRIMEAADSGSVITRDHAVGILTKLGTLKAYERNCLPLLLDQLRTCPTNQLAMYAEKSLAVATDRNKKELVKVLAGRLDDLEKDSQVKRLQKVLKRLSS